MANNKIIVVGGGLAGLMATIKAAEQGASSYRIVSAGGDNHLFGTAEIYK